MLKKIFIFGLAFYIASVSAGTDTFETYDDLKDQYLTLDDEAKTRIKKATSVKGWISVSRSNEFEALINFNYVEPLSNGGVQAWVKNVVINDVTKDGLSLGDYSMYLAKYDCSNRTYKNISYTDYNSKTGAILDSYTFPAYQGFKPVIPDSVGESQFNSVCFFSFLKQN